MGPRDFRRGLREVEIKWMRPPRHTYRHQTPLATKTHTHSHTLSVSMQQSSAAVYGLSYLVTQRRKILNGVLVQWKLWMRFSQPQRNEWRWCLWMGAMSGEEKIKRSYLPSWSRIHGHWAAACRLHWKLFIHLGHNVKEFKPVRPQNLEELQSQFEHGWGADV